MSIYRVVKLEDVVLDNTQPTFFDTETDGFYGRIELAQFFQEGWDQVLLVRRPCPYQLAAKLKYIVCHNNHYDISTIQKQTGSRWVPEKHDDTFFMSRLFYPHQESFSLDDCFTYALGFDPYERAGLDKKTLQKSDWSAVVLSEDQLTYAALDTYHMPELYNQVKAVMDEPSYVLDKSTLNFFLDMQWNGMPVDEDRLMAKWQKTEAEIAEIPMPVNANSPKQVCSWLNLDSSADAILAEMEVVQQDERAGRVRAVRSKKKLLSFLKKFDTDDNLIFGYFKVSTRSGRAASERQNLQQLPRASKDCFGYPEDHSRTLIYSDYAQLELRTICAILEVSVMEKLFREGEDLHGYVASILFGEDWTKADRQVTKTYNFNLLYGGSVGMVLTILLGYGFYIEPRIANKHRSKWQKLFPEIYTWQQLGISAWRKGRLDNTPLGRQYKGKLMTDQLNIKNQGAGAEVSKLAMHYLRPKLEEFNKTLAEEDQVWVCNFIHDSWILSSPNKPEVYKPAAALLAECMQTAWVEMSKCFKIKNLPMPINVRVGKNWGDIEEDVFDWEYNLEGMEAYERQV